MQRPMICTAIRLLSAWLTSGLLFSVAPSVFGAEVSPDETMTGEVLHVLCQAPANNADAKALQQGLCIGFIHGTLDTFLAFTDLTCVPDGISAGQAVKVVKRYLEKHPRQRPMPAPTLILLALTEEFPCGESEP